MTTRLLTIISGQPLPNYIAINEIRPDVVHCIYTPQHGGMKKRFEDLKEVVQRNIPDVRFEAHPIDNAYDSKGVWDLTVNLLTQHNNEDDDWMLNRSAGTEQMRGPLVAAFDNFYDDTLRGFFVETDHHRISQMDENWTPTYHPFLHDIGIQDYFALHGQTVTIGGTPDNNFEQRLLSELQKLDFSEVMPDCKWMAKSEILAQYDTLATYKYQLFTFEVKQIENATTTDLLDKFKDSEFVYDAKTRNFVHKDKNKVLVHDIEKLAYTRAIFGGPRGKAYWLMNGSFQPSASIQERMKRLNINSLIGGYTVAKELIKDPNKYGLPPLKRKTSKSQPI